jgi:hypothetical protein
MGRSVQKALQDWIGRPFLAVHRFGRRIPAYRRASKRVRRELHIRKVICGQALYPVSAAELNYRFVRSIASVQRSTARVA